MLSQVLSNPSQETHDDIMMLMSKVKKMKLGPSDKCAHLQQYNTEQLSVGQQLSYIFPSFSEEMLNQILANSMQESLANIYNMTPPSNTQENPFLRRRKFNEIGMDNSNAEVNLKPNLAFNLNRAQSPEDLKNLVYDFLMQKKDQIDQMKNEIILDNQIQNIQNENMELTKTLQVISNVHQQNKEKHSQIVSAFTKIKNEFDHVTKEIRSEVAKTEVLKRMKWQRENSML